MSDLIGIILIIVIGVLAYYSAQLIAGRKEKDEVLIKDLTKECALLNKNYIELKAKYDKLIEDRAQRRLNILKLGSKTKYVNLNKEEEAINDRP